MCGKNLAFWWFCALLFVASSSKHQLKSTSNEEIDDNLTIRYELDENIMTNYSDETETLRYDLYNKSINNTQNDELLTSSMSNDRRDDDSVQYELGTLFIENHENDSHMLREFCTNSTKVNSKKNFTSQEIYTDLMRIEGKNDSTSYEFYETSNGDDNKYIVPYEMCDNITCIPLCCSFGNRLIGDKCNLEKNKILTPFFPKVYEHINDSLQNESKRVDELFHPVIHNQFRKSQHSLLDFNTGHLKNKYMFFTNGSLYLPYNIFVESTSYCLAIMHQNKSDVICLETVNYQKKKQERKSMKSINNYVFNSLRIGSTLLLLGTFLVYAILPELRNTHGFMLCRYSAVGSAAYIIDFIRKIIKEMKLANFICNTIAILTYYCYMASYFWLTVMSFDMWWTFKKLHSLQRNVKQREKKILAIYSIYAWGFPFILTIVCGIMNFVPGASENLQPKLNCLFLNSEGHMLYFHVPRSICSISTICLSISTALKIRSYEKDAARYLRDSESQRYNENKKWFNLCLKLFIMIFILMGINLFTITWKKLYKLIYGVDYYNNIFRYIYNSLYFVQNLGTFIIFVCKKTIKRLLLKRFGCQKCHLFPKNRVHNVDATSSSTCTTTSGISIQENTSSYRQTNFDAINSSDVTEL